MGRAKRQTKPIRSTAVPGKLKTKLKREALTTRTLTTGSWTRSRKAKYMKCERGILRHPVVFIDVDGPKKNGELWAGVVNIKGQKIFEGRGYPEEITKDLEQITTGTIIAGHNVTCDLNRLTRNIAHKGIIDTQVLGPLDR